MMDILLMAGVFVIVFGAGYALIRKVPPMLHSPLMSMTNAVSGVTIIAALLLFRGELGPAAKVLACGAIAMAMFNVVGGFAVTDRMLRLFRSGRDTGCAKPR